MGKIKATLTNSYGDTYQYTTNTTNQPRIASWPNGFDSNEYWCQYYLPCGLCSRTNQPCPKHQQTFEPTWTCNDSSYYNYNSINGKWGKK